MSRLASGFVREVFALLDGYNAGADAATVAGIVVDVDVEDGGIDVDVIGIVDTEASDRAISASTARSCSSQRPPSQRSTMVKPS